MGTVTNRTPAGRIPNVPLRNPRHEAVAHAFVQGMTCREAGIAVGYKDGPGLTGNISRLRQTAVMRERIAEMAARAAELAEIQDAWILLRIKQLADCLGRLGRNRAGVGPRLGRAARRAAAQPIKNGLKASWRLSFKSYFFDSAHFREYIAKTFKYFMKRVQVFWFNP